MKREVKIGEKEEKKRERIDHDEQVVDILLVVLHSQLHRYHHRHRHYHYQHNWSIDTPSPLIRRYAIK